MEIDASKDTAPWYADGLRFKCTGCGMCCTGQPGYVFLSSMDLERLAAHFSMPTQEFLKKYTYRVEQKISLIDRPGSEDCVFLEKGRCSVYEARPVQCRTFPWWIYFLRDQKSWNDAKERCEGIDHPDAPVVPLLTIQSECLSYLDNLLDRNFS